MVLYSYSYFAMVISFSLKASQIIAWLLIAASILSNCAIMHLHGVQHQVHDDSPCRVTSAQLHSACASLKGRNCKSLADSAIGLQTVPFDNPACGARRPS